LFFCLDTKERKNQGSASRRPFSDLFRESKELATLKQLSFLVRNFVGKVPDSEAHATLQTQSVCKATLSDEPKNKVRQRKKLFLFERSEFKSF